MDSFSPDLRDALDEELARAGGGAGSSNASSSSSAAAAKKNNMSLCAKCEKGAAAVDRLRWCGGCRAAKYCSVTCARADWPAHKLVCKRMREFRDDAMASLEASGGRGDEKTYNKKTGTLAAGFAECLVW